MVIDGSVKITLGGVEHELEAGEMLIMPANVPHQLDALTPFKMMLTMIK
jgi:quercetin dioxygenase-like cupin family protein